MFDPGAHQCFGVAFRPLPPARGRERLHGLWARLRRRRLGEPYQCGQLHGHAGDCTWFTPGGYLPAPLITALDWFDARWQARGLPWWHSLCPMCGQRTTMETGERTLFIYCDAENAERDEVRWEFQPCGCTGREVTA